LTIGNSLLQLKLTFTKGKLLKAKTVMKKLSILIAVLSVFTLAVSAQKTINDANAEKRNVNGFHGIEVSGGIDLYLSQGEESVAISASEQKFRDRIKTEVRNGILKIWYESDKNLHIDISWKDRKMKAYVSFKTLDQLEGSGGSDISVDGTITVSSLSLDISGGSDFDGKVKLNDLKVDASGGSDVKISGSANKLFIDASGGSDFKGYELSVDECNLQASGGSDVYITVNKSLTADASGGSDIFYKGNAAVTEVKSSGSSSIKKTSR
jgi:Putative auto-transporter adhesin, head GIN domain